MPRSAFLYKLVILVWMLYPLPLHAAEPLTVEVEGIEGEALDNVTAALAIPPGLVRDGKVDTLWLKLYERQANDKVLTALKPFGYYKARISTAMEKDEEGNLLFRVNVEPGPPVLVSSAHVAVLGAGTGEEDLDDLVRDFPLQKGEVLQQQAYETAKNALLAKALELGYSDARFSAHEIRIAADKENARIDLVLDTGPKYLFGDTTITGAPDYPLRFLRRFLTYRPGETFSSAKLDLTQLNFINADRFREVIITLEKEKETDLRVPVLVQLKESPRLRLRLGVGYGTDTGARFTGTFRDLNMLHLGHELQVQLYLAQLLQGLTFGYMIPHASDVSSSTGAQLNLQREKVSSYSSRLISVEVDRNKGFAPGMLGTAYVQFLLEDYTVGVQNSSALLILPGLRFSARRFDDPVRPTSGYRYSLEVRGTHQYLGSDTGFIQFLADGNAIVPLPWRLSLLTRGSFGMSAQNDPLANLPASLRFFAGGDSSVRGYSYRSLGPRDITNTVVGGKDLITGSIELERALFAKWGVSAFFDTGNAFNDFSAIRLYSGAGVGIHYYTRIGAINLYLARQIGVTSPGYHIHFTMGFQL
ncbi:MAG TPA: autotransporter assembly complex family protein [Desulfuromonadaceae bacterium]